MDISGLSNYHHLVLYTRTRQAASKENKKRKDLKKENSKEQKRERKAIYIRIIYISTITFCLLLFLK
jgi:hypothetical protein